MSRKDTAAQGRKGERGSIFTVLLGAVALTAVVGVTAFQTLSGPVMTAVRVKNKTLAETEMLAAAKITLVDAVNQTGSGDCDGDTFIEPVAWRAGSGPTNAGLIPLTIGAPTTDPWGTSYGYCVWDVGPTFDNAACGGPGALRLNGSDTPLAGNADTQTVMAIVSAGPDRQFQTSCINYVDATTSVVTKGGDDLVLKYTYVEAGSAADGLWSVKSSDPDVATTTKDVEVGSFLQIDNASGQLWAGGGVELGDESLVTICDGTNVGLMRYNTAEAAVEVCDGVDWIELLGGDGGVTNGLVGYWKLDEGAGATAADSSGNGLDGTVSGATWTPSGYMGGAITFDGVNDYIEVPDDPLLDVTNVTVSAWVYKPAADLAGWGAFVSRQVGVGGNNTFWVGLDNSASDLYMCFINTADGFEALTGPASTGDANIWTHVVCTYDGADIRLYKNGAEIASTPHTGNMTAETNRMLIGADNEDNFLSPTDLLDATVDEVRLYDRALSAAEIISMNGVARVLDDLSDVYTDYTTDDNMIIGRQGASALTSGAKYNLFIGELAGASSSASTAATDYNTAVGFDALGSLISGSSNTAVGAWALNSLETGNNNVALGMSALSNSSSASNNTAVGVNAMFNNTTGSSNVAIGYRSLQTNQALSGSTAIGAYAMSNANSTNVAGTSYNTAVGYQALKGSATPASNTGAYNTAVGYNSMVSNTNGEENVAVGALSLNANTTGDHNSALGYNALVGNTSGVNNTALGYNALASNDDGTSSTAIGANALASSNGSSNVAVGYNALANGTSAQNTAVGAGALSGALTGGNNTAIGYNAGNTTTTGSGNILIGASVTAPAAGTSNHLNIGNTIYADLSNDYVGIGTATPNKRLHISGDLDDDGIILESYNGTDVDGAYLLFARSRGETSTGKTVVANGDEIGHLYFQAYDGSVYRDAAHIIANVDGAPGAGDTPSRLAFWTTPDGSGTAVERMRLDNAGNLGIGTTSPGELLSLSANSEKGLRIDVATSANANHNPFIALRRSRGTVSAPTIVSSGDNLGELMFYGYDGSAFRHAALIEVRVDGAPGASDMPSRIEFHVQPDGTGSYLGNDASPPELVIKNDGKIGMGTEAPDSLLHVYDDGNNAFYEALKVEGEGEPGVLLSSASATSWYNPLITVLRSKGTPTAPTVVSSGDTLFELQLQGYDGSAYRDAAYITAVVDGTPGASDMPGRIEFHTQADGGGAWLEGSTPEMVIKNNGAIGIATATPNQGKVEVKGGTVCVDTNSDNTASSCITTESDERLKKNIKPITNALEKVLKIRGVEFDWRWDEFDIASKWKKQPHGIGVIAQDVEKVFPEAMGEEDQGFKTVEYRYLVAPLIEAVRELSERNKAMAERAVMLEAELQRRRQQIGGGQP